MLKVLRMILAFIVISMAGYGLVTDHHWLQPYMISILGLMLVVMGLEKIQKGRREYVFLVVGGSLFLLMTLFTI